MGRRNRIVAVLGVATAVVLTAALVSGAATTSARLPMRMTVIEHATTDTLINTGAPGDTVGDLLTFANKLFNRTDERVIGRDQGSCIRTVAGANGSWECSWTNFLPGGHIDVQGPFFDTHDSVLSITGGTGIFANARGSMELRALAGGTKFAFVFTFVG